MIAGSISLNKGETVRKNDLGRTAARSCTGWLPFPADVARLAFCIFALLLCGFPQFAYAQQPGFTHFEARHTHSIALTPNGTRLLALNTPDARLSVFDISDASNASPTLIAEIPVGLEPVSIRARTDDEVWVVSELGDSVAVVSLSRRTVIDTLAVSDEPADVVFAEGKAFVSCARSQMIRVFDAASRSPLPSIPLEGNYPRSLATNPEGSKVYVAFLLSGNRTTVIPGSKVTAGERLAPTDPLLPAAPATALIVSASDSRVPYTVLDRDVAEIDAANGTVTRYLSGAGTNLFDLAVHPTTGDIWVANTEARNLIRFEPDLRGRIVDHRITKLAQADGQATVYDVNPGFNYFAPMPYAFGRNNSIAQPSAIAFTQNGEFAWVAGFNSDRLAKVSTSSGAIAQRVDVRPVGISSRGMRGPRALAIHAGSERLFVLNKLSNTISVVSLETGAVLLEIATGSYDPTPGSVKEGRGFLFDARISGRGIASCASCHLDADLDGLAWDLGDRAGAMVVVKGKNLSAHDETPRDRFMHPMKGPMVTQTLRGMEGGAPFHWRGDRPTLQSFNPTFDKLMGGAQIAAADMDELANYLFTLKHHPNPNLLPNGSLPATFNGGDVIRGKDLFENHLNHCISCHALPPAVTPNPALPPLPDPRNNIDLASEVGAVQPVKNPSLSTVYQRLLLKAQSGQSSISGFGLLHDGTGSVLPTVHPYVLDELQTLQDFADVTAFVLCFHTGTDPSVGASRTLTAATREDALALAYITLLENQTAAGGSELVVKGTIGGSHRSFRFDKTTQRYVADTATQSPLSRSALLSLLSIDDTLTFIGVPPGQGSRFGSDRNGNGILDNDEALPYLGIAPTAGSAVRLQWPDPSLGWFLQYSQSPSGPWQSMTRTINRSGGFQSIDESTDNLPAAFFRLRRTW